MSIRKRSKTYNQFLVYYTYACVCVHMQVVNTIRKRPRS